jgi:hypothetical protein
VIVTHSSDAGVYLGDGFVEVFMQFNEPISADGMLDTIAGAMDPSIEWDISFSDDSRAVLLTSDEVLDSTKIFPMSVRDLAGNVRYVNEITDGDVFVPGSYCCVCFIFIGTFPFAIQSLSMFKKKLQQTIFCGLCFLPLVADVDPPVVTITSDGFATTDSTPFSLTFTITFDVTMNNSLTYDQVVSVDDDCVNPTFVEVVSKKQYTLTCDPQPGTEVGIVVVADTVFDVYGRGNQESNMFELISGGFSPQVICATITAVDYLYRNTVHLNVFLS